MLRSDYVVLNTKLVESMQIVTSLFCKRRILRIRLDFVALHERDMWIQHRCGSCSIGTRCKIDNDCHSKLCFVSERIPSAKKMKKRRGQFETETVIWGSCVSCHNGVRDGLESDVDCVVRTVVRDVMWEDIVKNTRIVARNVAARKAVVVSLKHVSNVVRTDFSISVRYVWTDLEYVVNLVSYVAKEDFASKMRIVRPVFTVNPGHVHRV